MSNNSAKVDIGIIRGEPHMIDFFTGEALELKNATLIIYASSEGRPSGEDMRARGENIASILGNNVTVDYGGYFGPDTPPGIHNARIRISVPNDEKPFLDILKRKIMEAGRSVSASVVERSKTEFFETHAVPVEIVSHRIPVRRQTAAATV